MNIIRAPASKLIPDLDEASSLSIVAISSVVIGFLLGALVYPTWTDNVESAQVLAGLVKYNSATNPMYIYHRSAYSLLIQGAALLLRLGVSDWATSVLFSGAQSAIGFSALALCTFAISRNIFSSLLTPFVLLRLSLSPSATSGIYLSALHGHNYPILFPTHASLYGLLGLFLTLLIISLIALRRNTWGLFLLGVIPAIHPSLALMCWLAVGLGFVWERKSEIAQLRPFFKFFVGGLALFLLTFTWQQINNPSVAALSFSPPTKELVGDFLKYWDEHNAVVAPLTLPFFFEVDLYLIILATSYLVAFPQPFFSPGRFIAKALLGTTLVATLYTVLQSLFPFLLPVSLNDLLHKLLIYRWLNLNSVAMPAILIGLLSGLALHNRNLIALTLLVIIAFGALSNNLLSLSIASATPYLQYYSSQNEKAWVLGALAKSLLFPLAALGASYVTLKSTRPGFLNVTYPAPWAKLLNPFLLVALVLLMVVSFSPFAFAKFTGTDENSTLLAKAGQAEGLMLSAPLWGTHIQTRMRRPLLLDLTQINLISYLPGTATTIEDILNIAYGLSLKDPRGYSSYDTLASIWSRRTLAEWQTLRQRFGVTHVITPSNYKLQLPLFGKSRDLVIYEIPAPTPRMHLRR